MPMRSRGLARSQVLAGCACAALTAPIAGCTAPSSSTVTVSGTTLTIYASAPSQTEEPPVSQDVLDAEQLALRQGDTQLGRFTIRFIGLHGRVSDNARKAIQDSTTIAYLGEVVPHSSYASLGITNAVDVLQVSPTDTALELTQQTSAVRGSPNVYYESLKTYGRTFARVVPSTALEAKAHVQEMRALGVKRLYVADDGSDYGRTVALAVKNDAGRAVAVQSKQAGADAIFYGAGSQSTAARFFNQLGAGNSTVKLFGPSTLDDQRFASQLTTATRNVYLSAPGFLAKDLNAAGRKFVSDFRDTFHRVPAPEAIFGYEAMSAVLSVLRGASSGANNRATVVHDFFALKNRDSVLGTYSINANGDTTLGPFIFSRLSRGRLVPYRFVQAQG